MPSACNSRSPNNCRLRPRHHPDIWGGPGTTDERHSAIMWGLSYLPLISGPRPTTNDLASEICEASGRWGLCKGLFLNMCGVVRQQLIVAAGGLRMDACVRIVICSMGRGWEAKEGSLFGNLMGRRKVPDICSNFIYLIAWGSSYSPTFTPD